MSPVVGFPSYTLRVAGPNSIYKFDDVKPAGFLSGVWHGVILPNTFFVSLFDPGVRIYETNNNGRWYDFGFLIGTSLTLGGSGGGAA